MRQDHLLTSVVCASFFFALSLALPVTDTRLEVSVDVSTSTDQLNEEGITSIQNKQYKTEEVVTESSGSDKTEADRSLKITKKLFALNGITKLNEQVKSNENDEISGSVPITKDYENSLLDKVHKWSKGESEETTESQITMDQWSKSDSEETTESQVTMDRTEVSSTAYQDTFPQTPVTTLSNSKPPAKSGSANAQFQSSSTSTVIDTSSHITKRSPLSSSIQTSSEDYRTSPASSKSNMFTERSQITSSRKPVSTLAPTTTIHPTDTLDKRQIDKKSGTSSYNVNENSICTWSYSNDNRVEDLRWPNLLQEVVCDPNCTKCIKNEGYACKPVYNDVFVLRRTREVSANDIKYSSWKISSERIAVACVCAK